MNKLERKLIRDFRSSKGLFIAVIIIIFLAVSFFGSMYMAYRNLDTSYTYSYDSLRFADLTVKVARDATDAVSDLQRIEGVRLVTGRMNADYALTLPGETSHKALARVLSLPDAGTDRDHTVNDVLIDEGTYFPAGEANNILIEKNFADYHGLKPGQTVTLGNAGEEIPFQIAGVAVSPEYIFPAKSRQEIMVSAEVWGVVFVSEDARTEILRQPVNEVCFLFDKDIDEAAVTDRIKSALQDYQIMDVVPRSEQPSYTGLEMDLEQFQTLSELFPLLFIIVGSMATYIMLTRIVHNQRTQIGLMRAVGHTRRRVVIHYLSFALFIGIAGAVLGTIAGYFAAEAMTGYYAGMINLPLTVTEIQWDAIVISLLLGLLPCAIAGLMPAWAASRIPPAEAMRPPAPASGRKLLLERLLPFISRLSSLWKVPLRNIFRNRRRSLYTAIGVTFGVSLILISAAMIDSIESLMDFMFKDVQRYDVRIDFAGPQPADIADEVASWEGVERVEGTLQIPVRLDHGEETYSTLGIVLPVNGELRGLYETSGRETSVTGKGVLVSQGLPGALDVGKGDTITVTSMQGSAAYDIVGVVKDPMGSFVYMTPEQARTLTGGSDLVNGLLLRADPAFGDAIRERAYQMESVASVELTSETRARYDELMESGTVMLYIMLLFGATLAMAIVFTTVTVNILERRREIATMRTIGEGKWRIAAMITIENLILGAAGLVPGIILGYLMGVLFFGMFQGDMFTMDLVVFPRTYGLTVCVVIIIMILSQVPGIRNINRLNLSQVVKEQAT